ncbi:alpha/beta fold hydrolase [Gordonia terrae]|uniref:Alpha/beta hydrolase n=1 Tax=Gordonia terrae TaxID=2055 RepID=A0AAD0NYH6_9ACTN|nr:alpha/beta fold hydrolase [Gordonia terrae]ANY22235.1 alpha/beta hydrolase [Gordonia terrae]AWO82974.1 alpha/beta hydrolase [Gordonia terrae]
MSRVDQVTPETPKELRTPSGVIRYYERGEGPPLVLLHGSGPGVTGWRNFAGNLDVFAAHHRTFIVEFPGFGVSDDFGGHPMFTAQQAVVDFLDGLQLDKVAVVGNSMGGVIGASLAIEHPERVSKLVTIGGIGTNLFSPGPGEGIKLLMEFTDEPTRERLIRWLHSMVYDPDLVTEQLVEQRWAQATDPATLESARKMYGSAAFGQMLKAAAASTEPALWAKFNQIRIPVLVTWGRDDRVSPLDMALVPMRTLPRGELHVFPNCGHWVMIEQKEAFESAVLAFLARKD